MLYVCEKNPQIRGWIAAHMVEDYAGRGKDPVFVRKSYYIQESTEPFLVGDYRGAENVWNCSNRAVSHDASNLSLNTYALL